MTGRRKPSDELDRMIRFEPAYEAAPISVSASKVSFPERCSECDAPLKTLGELTETCVGYESPPGHDHNDNCKTRSIRCANGHRHQVSLQRRCPACEWAGKATCWCCEFAKVDSWPALPKRNRPCCYLSTVLQPFLTINVSGSPPLPDVQDGEGIACTLRPQDPIELSGVIVAHGWSVESLTVSGEKLDLRPAVRGEGAFHPLGTTFLLIDAYDMDPSQDAIFTLRNLSGKPQHPLNPSIVIHFCK